MDSFLTRGSLYGYTVVGKKINEWIKVEVGIGVEPLQCCGHAKFTPAWKLQMTLTCGHTHNEKEFSQIPYPNAQGDYQLLSTASNE